MNNSIASLLIIIAQSISFISIFQVLIQKKIKLIYIIVFPIFMLLSHIVLNYFFFIPLIIYLFFLGKQTAKNIDISVLWFYSVYSIFFNSLIAYSFVQFFSHIIGQTTYAKYSFFLSISLVLFSPVLVNNILIKLLKPNFDYLRRHSHEINHSFLFIINILITFCCFFTIL